MSASVMGAADLDEEGETSHPVALIAAVAGCIFLAVIGVIGYWKYRLQKTRTSHEPRGPEDTWAAGMTMKQVEEMTALNVEPATPTGDYQSELEPVKTAFPEELAHLGSRSSHEAHPHQVGHKPPGTFFVPAIPVAHARAPAIHPAVLAKAKQMDSDATKKGMSFSL